MLITILGNYVAKRGGVEHLGTKKDMEKQTIPLKQRRSLLEVINIDELRDVCEKFTRFTNAVTAILDLEGNIILETGWQEICTCFHRIHATTLSRCRESDTILARQLRLGESFTVYKCRNGLVDVAMPILIRDEHVANFFIGQFLFEVPDKEFFIRQANEYGFDQSHYLATLSKVPIFSEDYIKQIMEFISSLVRTIGETGLIRRMLEETNQRLEQDIIERKREKIALQESEERLRFVLEGSRLGFWDWNLVTAEVNRNRQWAEMLGYSFEEIQSTTKQWEDFVHPDDRLMAWQSINNHLKGKTPLHELEYRMFAKDGTYKWINDRAMVMVRDKEGNPLRMSGTHTDVTDRKNAEERLLYYSNHDPLTGLYNRAYIDVELSHAACGRRFPIGIIVGDLDNLKSVNDTLGHAAGDWLIKSAGEIIEKACRAEDVVARTGGDEYVVILYEIEAAAFSAVVAKIRAKAERFNQKQTGPNVEISLGAALAMTGEEVKEALKRADDAMYSDKRLRKLFSR